MYFVKSRDGMSGNELKVHEIEHPGLKIEKHPEGIEGKLSL